MQKFNDFGCPTSAPALGFSGIEKLYNKNATEKLWLIDYLKEQWLRPCMIYGKINGK